ncbi:hypothetical protein AX279_19690 [Pseudomonas sp. J237]|nr:MULTISPECIES: hypothetical protein [Pseudomonas]OEO24057.1 hypothetical protein AX279_19690 [Pseudomonas sp. J237]
MIKIVATGLKETQDKLERAQKQIPFATALALTRTAQIVKKDIEAEMANVFDRPTKWTLNSLRLLPAKKDKLEAWVRMKNEADKSTPATTWLSPEIEGGARPAKRREKSLRAKGALPDGEFIAPGRDAKLNQYGNISRSHIQKILSGLVAQFDPYQNSTGSRRSAANKRAFFVISKGNRPIGIAQRTSKRGIKLLLAFVSRPTYSKRLDFYGVAQKAIDTNLEKEMAKALKQAFASAR